MSARAKRWRTPLLYLAGARAAVGIAAIPFAPVLFKDHFLVLVLLRPTKEVLLAGGFLVREGRVGLLPLVAASLPLMLLGVWQFFAMGRGYAKELHDCDLPGLGGRILPVKRVRAVSELLERKGRRLVVLGRLAVLPSSLVGAAAGGSGMPARRFLPADLLGALLALVEVVGAGYLLGSAYRDAGPWLTGVGVAVLLVMMWLLGRWLKRC